MSGAVRLLLFDLRFGLLSLGGRRMRILALGHDRCPEASAEVVRQFVYLRIAINLDCAFSGVADDVAVVAPLEMIFELGFGPGVHRLIKVVGKLL